MDNDNLIDDLYDGDEKDHRYIEYAGFWIRVGAAILDGLILIPVTAFEFYNKISMNSLPLFILGTVLTICYKPYLEYTRGATLGKSIVGIKVVNEDHELMSLDQTLLRFMPWAISYFIAFMLGLQFYTGGLEATSFMEMNEVMVGTFWSNLNSMYSIVFLVIIIVVAFDSKKQGLHDKIAQTYCVMTK